MTLPELSSDHAMPTAAVYSVKQPSENSAGHKNRPIFPALVEIEGNHEGGQSRRPKPELRISRTRNKIA
jgi:hypothetical protein